MKTTIEPFIQLDDKDYMMNFSLGYHGHGAPTFNIDTISIGYPVADWRRGEVRPFKVKNGTNASVGMIMLAAADIVKKECKKGNNYAPHIWSDYCIERITIRDNVATIEFGS